MLLLFNFLSEKYPEKHSENTTHTQPVAVLLENVLTNFQTYRDHCSVLAQFIVGAQELSVKIGNPCPNLYNDCVSIEDLKKLAHPDSKIFKSLHTDLKTLAAAELRELRAFEAHMHNNIVSAFTSWQGLGGWGGSRLSKMLGWSARLTNHTAAFATLNALLGDLTIGNWLQNKHWHHLAGVTTAGSWVVLKGAVLEGVVLQLSFITGAPGIAICLRCVNSNVIIDNSATS